MSKPLPSKTVWAIATGDDFELFWQLEGVFGPIVSAQMVWEMRHPKATGHEPRRRKSRDA